MTIRVKIPSGEPTTAFWLISVNRSVERSFVSKLMESRVLANWNSFILKLPNCPVEKRILLPNLADLGVVSVLAKMLVQ